MTNFPLSILHTFHPILPFFTQTYLQCNTCNTCSILQLCVCLDCFRLFFFYTDISAFVQIGQIGLASIQITFPLQEARQVLRRLQSRVVTIVRQKTRTTEDKKLFFSSVIAPEKLLSHLSQDWLIHKTVYRSALSGDMTPYTRNHICIN